MSPRIKRRITDLLLLGLGVCICLPVYITNHQYARSHAAWQRAYKEADKAAGEDNPEKHTLTSYRVLNLGQNPHVSAKAEG
jgi:hypothetical protein